MSKCRNITANRRRSTKLDEYVIRIVYCSKIRALRSVDRFFRLRLHSCASTHTHTHIPQKYSKHLTYVVNKQLLQCIWLTIGSFFVQRSKVDGGISYLCVFRWTLRCIFQQVKRKNCFSPPYPVLATSDYIKMDERAQVS